MHTSVLEESGGEWCVRYSDKMLRLYEPPKATAIHYAFPDVELRKCGIQMGLETPVVRTVNIWALIIGSNSVVELTR